jgi:hypothetical protein
MTPKLRSLSPSMHTGGGRRSERAMISAVSSERASGLEQTSENFAWPSAATSS